MNKPDIVLEVEVESAVTSTLGDNFYIQKIHPKNMRADYNPLTAERTPERIFKQQQRWAIGLTEIEFTTSRPLTLKRDDKLILEGRSCQETAKYFFEIMHLLASEKTDGLKISNTVYARNYEPSLKAAIPPL